MPYYECVLIARQDVPASQVEALTNQFSEVVGNGGGKVTKTEYWGLKTLAYRIKKNRKGHYALLNIDAPHPAVAEMERLMRLHDDVLRHQVVKVEELEEGPSAMMQAKAGRDDRRGGRGDRDRDRGDRGGRDRDRGDRGDRGGRDRDRGDRGDRGDRPERSASQGD
jgi:small subunit ribosomal protein S6